MTFEFSYDYPLIRRVLTEARSWRRMKNDHAPHVDEFEVVPGLIQYVLAFEGGMVCGVFLLLPSAPGYTECHFCLSPQTWGDTERVGREFMLWVWINTSIQVVYGPVPSYNRLALKLAKACGFQPCGTHHHAGTKGGVPFDLILTKATRPW